MRVLHAAAVIALLAAPAYAQQKSIPKYGEAPVEKTRSEIEEDREAERAYKRSLGNIPDQTPTDPWGTRVAWMPPRPLPSLSRETEDQDQRHRKLGHDPDYSAAPQDAAR